MAIKVIAMRLGSAESLSTACLVFYVNSTVRPKTQQIAFNSLVEFLYQRWIIDWCPELPNKENEKKECCQKATGNFCSICGNALNKNQSFNYEELWNDWDSFIEDIFKSDSSNYYKDLVDVPNPFQWEPGFVPVTKNKLICIDENAEIILSLALEKLHPELGECTFSSYIFGSDEARICYNNIMENCLGQNENED